MEAIAAFETWLCKTTGNRLRLRDLVLFCGFSVAYVGLRLARLRSFPVFNDEGIYIEWAKTALNDAAQRFISLTDGKQPLQTWATIPLLRWLPGDSVFAARLFAVLSGYVALVGVFALLCVVSTRRAAYFGMALYVLVPCFLFHDRMALVDSAVNASVIWTMCLSILLAGTLRLDIALLLGLVAGAAMLTKSSVTMFVGLVITAPLLCTGSDWRERWQRRLRCLLLLGVSYALVYLIYNIQNLSPHLHNVSSKNYTFVLAPEEFLRRPFVCFRANVLQIPLIITQELGYLPAGLAVLGGFRLYKADSRLAAYFGLWIFLPLVVVIFITRTPYPRYLIFFSGFACVLAALFLGSLSSAKFRALGAAAVLLSTAYADYAIVLNPGRVPFPKLDRWQYIEGWPSGWGVEQVLTIAREEAKGRPVMILAEGNFGLGQDVLRASLKPSDTNIVVEGRYPLDEAAVASAKNNWRDKTVLFMFVHRRDFPTSWPLQLLARFDKPGGQSSVFLHRLVRD